MRQTLPCIPEDAIAAARPFLKWAGGKTQLLDEIAARLPAGLAESEITTYVEPFVGGGAVFFWLAQHFAAIERFVLLDVNDDLVKCYTAIKGQCDAVVRELGFLQNSFLPLNGAGRKRLYLDIREEFNEEKTAGFTSKTAAKLIFLNRTCFNGLYRVNRKGRFNVPFGDYKNPRICDEQNLRAVSAVLQNAEVICGDFTDSDPYIDSQTFVYFDPPYRPLSPTASFTSYSKDSFSEEDQVRLAQFCRHVDERGAKFLLSNSDPKNEDPSDRFFETHYCEFKIAAVKAKRAINCKASGRGEINELLLTNYGVSLQEK